jgi:hypothetical protein
LRYGVSGLTPTAGGGLAALAGDLKQLMTALVTAGAGRDSVLVMNPAQALTLSLVASPKFDMPVLQSSDVPATTVIMVEASSVASAFSGVPEFEVGPYPLLTMEDTSPPADPMTGQPTKSMFQSDSLGLRVMRAPHIAWLTAVTW